MDQDLENQTRTAVVVRNSIWPGAAEVFPPSRTAEGAFWRDEAGRPYALPELLLGADGGSIRSLLEAHVQAILALLCDSLTCGDQTEARKMRHWARRLVGELDGWWVQQAREAREDHRGHSL